MPRYLRNRNDGWIYEWDAILAANPVCEEVSEEEAYPERFVKPEVVEKAKRGILRLSWRLTRRGAYRNDSTGRNHGSS